MEYLAITPHSHKFMFRQISEALEMSINSCSDFNAYSAACAFDALAQYAANLITQPWRREFKEIKVSSPKEFHCTSVFLVFYCFIFIFFSLIYNHLTHCWYTHLYKSYTSPLASHSHHFTFPCIHFQFLSYTYTNLLLCSYNCIA